MVIAVPTGVKLIGYFVWDEDGFSTGFIMSYGFYFFIYYWGFNRVRHFHYVLRLGAVFGIFTGCVYNKLFMVVVFILMFVGVNLTFFPLHFAGLHGYPRKYLDYPDIYSSFFSYRLVLIDNYYNRSPEYRYRSYLDAMRGILRILNYRFSNLGVYYGQCSEICGANHSFIPIAVEVTLLENFKS
uniref:Cytochrome c oxidase subunit 1 n=1 Tax=Angiostrongylus costaricensis TaxID=334426 RepID=A0A0R3PQF4_ANGCS